jgi:hypothetical protein
MRLRIIILALAALFVFSGALASAFEGTAVVAPEGELPATGRFIATQHFPVNTVVDITNLENNRRVLVIVANNFSSPGLVAIVSREAAELIGMKPGSLSRIIMRIAYQRFPEDFNAGTPGYDPRNALSEEDLLYQVYGGDTYSPSDENGGNSQTAQADSLWGPRYIPDRPEWSGPEIINLFEEKHPPFEPIPPEKEQTPPPEEIPPAPVQPPEQRPPVDPVVEPPARVTEQPQRDIIKDPSVHTPVVLMEEADKDPSVHTPVALMEEADKDPSVHTPVVLMEEADKDPSVHAPVISMEEAGKDPSDYIMLEQREDVAKDTPVRPEENTEPPKPGPDPEPGPGPDPDPEPGPGPQLADSELKPTDMRPPPPEESPSISPSDIIPELIIPPARETPRPPVPAVADSASDRILPYLERGRYYVQIASADSLESAENIIRQIDSRYDLDRYEPKVYRDSNNRFCVLLKPMNQGESAAVLQRFKSIGYRDAFVRSGS